MSPEKRKTATRARKASPTSRRRVYTEKHIIFFLFGISFVLALFLGTLLAALISLKIPDIDEVVRYKPLQTTVILDRHGEVIHQISAENRRVIPFTQMGTLLPNAFVAAEDGRFYDHKGLDPFSVFRAFVNNIKEGRRGQGGSTITQQVAKLLLLSPEKTYLRKFKEAALAWRIDTLLTKEEILYIYLNQIYLGEGAYGVEAAAQRYFGKSAKQLSLAEVALLAGLPQAPNRYSPLRHFERAKARQKYVLNRMADDGYITASQANQGFEQRLVLQKNRRAPSRENGYFVEVVKKQVRDFLGSNLERTGIQIHTTLDANMQQQAVQAVRTGLQASLSRQSHLGQPAKRKSPQGALVSLDAHTSEVRAFVGGFDFVTTPYNRATSARRQAGSVFKPLIYAAALAKGWTPQSMIEDRPLALTAQDGKKWSPKNFDGRYRGRIPLMEALVHSSNVAAVRLLSKVGVKRVQRLAHDLEIHSPLTSDLSLALGAVDVSLLEMTASYSPFVNGGNFAAPIFITKIVASDGKVLFTDTPRAQRVLSKTVADQMRAMLVAVVERGTGRAARGLPVVTGGKTGTSNDSRDAWFIGFTDRYLTGVWVGHDRNSSLGRGESGGRTAAPIWLDYMKKLQLIQP